jgi:biopolymer transport protein ExbB
MFEIIKSGGFIMYPLLLCSLVAMGIIIERFWSLRKKHIIPENLVSKVYDWMQNDKLDKKNIEKLSISSPLGKILATGLLNRQRSREAMKESIEEVGAHITHELGCCLNMLGTIASITPLLGLLGTVFGMIDVFSTITTQGVGDAAALAGGISTALITTATGLSIAIPSLLFYRYLRGQVEELVILMEQEALKLLNLFYAENNTILK